MKRDIVVLGGSAGSIETLAKICEELPAAIPCALLVVVHLAPDVRSYLPEVIGRHSRLHTAAVQDGETLRKGAITVAVPGQHLVQDGVLRTVRGPRENGHRPALDPSGPRDASNPRPHPSTA